MSWEQEYEIDGVSLKVCSGHGQCGHSTAALVISASDAIQMTDSEILDRVRAFRDNLQEVIVAGWSNDRIWLHLQERDLANGTMNYERFIEIMHAILDSSLTTDSAKSCAMNAIVWANEREASIRKSSAKREASKRRRAQFRNRRDETVLALIERDGYECSYCGRTSELEIDHIYPLSKGGGDDLDNLQFLCRTCNAFKADRIPE